MEQEAAIRQVLSSDRKTSHLLLSWQDIDILESANKALAPLKEFTDIMSGETYVTVSAIKPILKHLEEDVLAENDDDTTLTRDIKQRVIGSLTARYSDAKVNQILNMASFLDP